MKITKNISEINILTILSIFGLIFLLVQHIIRLNDPKDPINKNNTEAEEKAFVININPENNRRRTNSQSKHTKEVILQEANKAELGEMND